MEFVEGAAYVRSNQNYRDQVVIFSHYKESGDPLFIHSARDGSGRSKREAKLSAIVNPDDLVCIWKPGDKVIPQLDPTAQYTVLGTTGTPSWEKAVAEGPTGGWFYPTRYNEHPGRYQDELERNLEFKDARPHIGNRWHLVGTNTWYKIPLDERHPTAVTPIAVRWVGELDG